MKKEMFEGLKQSLREAVEINRGHLKPSRAFTIDPKRDIPKIREKLGVSQSKLAAALGISLDTLQNWEQGRRQPAGPAKVLLKILSNNENEPRLKNAVTPLAMDRQQLEVYELLRSYEAEHSKLHEWYRGALEIINSVSPDKVAQAAHSIRELCDKLPGRMGIPVFQTPLPLIRSLQHEFLGVKASNYAGGWEGQKINIPLKKLLLGLEEIFRLINEPPRTERLKLALTATDVHAALMSKQHREARDEAFKRIGSFFQDAAHHKRLVTESEFREELKLFESLLLNYLTPCTAAQQKELIALIKEAPSPENVNKVKKLTAFKGANFVFFFQTLDNPDWLQPLNREGYFVNLPGPEPAPNGQIGYRIHPPLLALTKMAGIAPQAVTDILSRLKLPDNRMVGDQILECMAKIHDRACISQLRPLIVQLNKNLGRTSWLRIEELLKNWVEAEAYSDAFDIAQSFLFAAVDASFEGVARPDSWLARQVNEKILEPLTEKFPFETFNILFKALVRWAAQDREKNEATELEDVSPFSYWLEDFKSPPLHYRELEGMLASRLYASACCIYKRGNSSEIIELGDMLRSNPWHLFQRLRWQLYADYPDLSLEDARADVLKRIPFMNQIEHERGSHDYEFVQLLENHAKKHGDMFLSADEIKTMFDVVMTGPLHKTGEQVEGFDKEVFRRKQLQPIASLLRGEQLAAYLAFMRGPKKLEATSYKPYNPGVTSYEVVTTAPPDDLGSMGDKELWDFLNTWQPKAEIPKSYKMIREDVRALASKFGELITRQPDRFKHATGWWKNLRRPIMIYKCLEQANDHFIRKQNDNKNSIPAPSDSDWGNWFGIVSWIIANKKAETQYSLSGEPDWSWAWNSVPRFLRMALKTDYVIPEIYLSELREVFPYLIQEDSIPWDENTNPGMSDWLTTAINSNRGNSVEAMLNLAFRQKKAGKEIESWIFELIQFCLERPGESPAIFALLGANLRFFIHLFGTRLKNLPDLLFPPNKPTHLKAAVISYFRYDVPWPPVLDMFPDLVNIALKILKAGNEETKNDNAEQEWRDFGSRLGTQIAFYYWNEKFPNGRDGEAALDRFFATANKSVRARLINHIGLLFEKNVKNDAEDKIIPRVMRLWERRFAQITEKLKKPTNSSQDYEAELTEFTDWLSCECFPFEWRYTHAKQAIEKLKKPHNCYRLLKTIADFGTGSDRLEAALQLLRSILAKPSDELRWSIQFKELSPIILLGLASEHSRIKRFADECLDLLLKLGCSDFLPLDKDRGKVSDE